MAMNERERFVRYLMRRGASATITQITGGSACPCFTFRDPNNPAYYPEWHRTIDSTAEDCNGTGIIGGTKSSFDIKALFSIGIQSLNMMMLKELQSVIGDIQKDDLIMYGQCKTDGTFFDISALDEKKDYITYNSNNYFVRHYFDINFSGNVGQVSLLKRMQ